MPVLHRYIREDVGIFTDTQNVLSFLEQRNNVQMNHNKLCFYLLSIQLYTRI